MSSEQLRRQAGQGLITLPQDGKAIAQSGEATSLRAHSWRRESLSPLTQSISYVAEVWARSTRLPLLSA